MFSVRIIFFFTVILILPLIMKSEQSLSGAGASFPAPFYEKAFQEYSEQKKIQVSYKSIGSSSGIRQISAQLVDFGASDAFLSDDKLKSFSSEIFHIPTCIGAVAVTYHLPGNPELNFTPEILADIFLGKINKWNDSQIKKINPNVNLPELEIIVAHRSDGSGTTAIFSNYLCKISQEWKEKIGEGKTLTWPTGLGAKGNSQLADMITKAEGSIGYVSSVYAVMNQLPTGAIKNKSGNFIKPSLKSISAAGNALLPDDTRINITNTDSEAGYPISSFTWILFYEEQSYKDKSIDQANSLADLLLWLIHEGQQYASALHYAPLPKPAVSKAETIIKKMKYQGKNIR